MSAVEIVSEKTDKQCHVSLCSESGCTLSMTNAPEPRVLLSLEHEASPADAAKPHCDFLFVGGCDHEIGEWVAPVELTASAARVSKFLPQRRAGAEIANYLIPRNLQV